MKLHKTFILFLLVVCPFIFSCTKEKVQVNPRPLPTIPLPPTSPTIARNLINAQILPVGNLSQARRNIAVASARNKIVFAGGEISPDVHSAKVDIFDITTNSWTTAELSQARTGIATAVLDKKIYFAGGVTSGSVRYSGRVDIFDTERNSWTTSDLENVQELMVGAAVGNKVVFASGVTAHIYETSTNKWSTAPLSERPGEGNCCQSNVGGIAATVIGNTIYFAGGLGFDVHKAIDIYDAEANNWSKSSLSEYKGAPAGIAVGNINYWAGGYTYPDGLSSKVEMRNMNSGAVSIGNLFQGNHHFSSTKKGYHCFLYGPRV